MLLIALQILFDWSRLDIIDVYQVMESMLNVVLILNTFHRFLHPNFLKLNYREKRTVVEKAS